MTRIKETTASGYCFIAVNIIHNKTSMIGMLNLFIIETTSNSISYKHPAVFRHVSC